VSPSSGVVEFFHLKGDCVTSIYFTVLCVNSSSINEMIRISPVCSRKNRLSSRIMPMQIIILSM
jgi:hypothetical protein